MECNSNNLTKRFIMKKSTIFIMGLLALGATQIRSMESQQVALDKTQQKEFRATLAGYRGAYILQQLLENTGRKEVKAETRLRKDLESLLNDYKRLHGDDSYVAHKLQRLEKFKNEEMPGIFKQLSQLKTEDI